MKSATITDPSAAAAEDALRQLVENLGVALIATDADLRIQRWNAAASRLFGASPEAMIGTPAVSLVPQDRRPLAERLFRRVLETKEVTDFEFQERDASGNHRDLVVTIAAISTEAEGELGISLCIRDITRRIALQNELNEARKMRALGEMAGAVAHHFNNILGGVITSVDYAKSSNDPAITAKVLDQSSRALLRATALVNGLLVFSDGGKTGDDLSDLTEILYEIADDVERQSAGRKVQFVFHIPHLPVLPMARKQVQTILRNIIQNALEAMPEGGLLRLDVALEPEHVVIAITDTGCGLDENARSRIFEPFWSTKNTPGSEPGRVKGLGLAIVYGLVQVLGGSIAVTSQPHKGSCFKISLPRPPST